MKKFYRVMTYVLTALLASALTLGVVVYQQRSMPAGESKLDQLEGLIAERFIGEVDTTAIEDAAAGAMVGALGDRWSYYITAEDYRSYQAQMSNAYVGVGITISQREEGDGLDIVSVTAGGPAEEAGLLAGDVLVKADGQSLAGLSLEDTRALVLGEEGTTVALTVRREAEERTFTVERRQFETPVTTARLLPEGCGLITIENFNSRCADETIAAIDGMIAQGATALIFDVRNNPGGYKDELVKVLDYLLPEGLLFRSESYTGKITDDRSDAGCIDLPMAVLVNGDSYSAAEFFAAALSEYGVATVVGEQTCGKGYYQNTFRLSDGSAVGLSVGKYYTPNGVSLAGVGITPDVQVNVEEETARGIYLGTLEPEDDPQIQAAVTALKGE